MIRRGIIVALFGLCLGLGVRSEDRVDFNFEVRPILSDRCFFCHGPDEKARKAKLRLDQKDDYFAPRKDGKVVVKPGEPDASELLRRIVSTDPDEVMPPPASHLELSVAEKDVLRRWIQQGADWQGHWAFSPITQPALPTVQKPGWAVSPIDYFVQARLEKLGLEPSPKADRARLLRRLSLDLTGLPPQLTDVEAFVSDASPNAYEKAVDRLLASPAYGERMAVDWLDLARYADTYGYQADVDRDLSPWRDWVIGAFNRNLPYDQFITWQVAGDLLPEATDEQILATAFNRLHRQTNEGGSIEEEFRHEYVSDRVHTMGTTFLGLTLECARCHDHKYDPITQRDYYSLSAFFDNIDESGLYSHFTQATPTPTLLRWEGDAKSRHAELVRQIARAESKLQTVAADAGPRLAGLPAGERRLQPVAPIARYSFESVTNRLTPDSSSTNFASLSEGPESVAGKEGQALRFSGDNSVIIPAVGNFKRTDPFSFSLWIQPMEEQSRAVVFHYSRAWTDSGSRGYELVLDHGKPFFGLIHFWPGNAIAIRAQQALPTQVWTHLTVTYDGSSRADGLRIYRDGVPLATEVVRDNLYRDILHRSEWGDGEVGGIRLTLGARFRDSGFRRGAIDEFQVFDVCLTPAEVRALHGVPETNPVPALDVATYLARRDESYRQALAELKEARDKENDLANAAKEIMVMKEMSPRRQTTILKRGAYDAPGDPVGPDVPSRILSFPETAPRNRLGFAQWLTSPQNPLTARVAVNRAWKQHFGRGLVSTLNDFGAQGQLPTHPALLDWLASSFIQSGWDLKALHKAIVMSATYQQVSEADAERLAKDPDNRWLSRGPKHRLSAEQIRDEALAASGLLNDKLGGPSVKPYQPVGVWEEAGTGKSYSQDHGEKLYRRSLYTFWRRTAPPPSMLSFDAVTREVCTANREVTATPLQALVLMNDPQFLEAARVLAEKLWQESELGVSARLDRGFVLVTGRRPTARESAVLNQLYSEQRAYFERQPEAAGKLLSTGERKVNAALPPVDLAAATMVVSTLMNHDEFVMKR